MNAFSPAVLNPRSWGETLSGAPVLDRAVGGTVPTLVRHWRDIAPDIDQSALDQHYLSMHLGGAKRLSRRGEGSCQTRDVPAGAYSLIPAQSAFHWQTEGPIDFAHFYFTPAVIGHVVASAFDRDPDHVRLEDCLGQVDPLVERLAVAVLEELAEEDWQPAYLDDLLHLMLCRLLRQHSNARTSAVPAKHLLAPYRLRRVIEYIDSHLADPIGVADIAAEGGVSRFHFSRAFRATTGQSPYAYLLDRRVAAARGLLIDSDLSLTAIAARCGFSSLSQFSRMFRRATNIAPSRFRDRH